MEIRTISEIFCEELPKGGPKINALKRAVKQFEASIKKTDLKVKEKMIRLWNADLDICFQNYFTISERRDVRVISTYNKLTIKVPKNYKDYFIFSFKNLFKGIFGCCYSHIQDGYIPLDDAIVVPDYQNKGFPNLGNTCFVNTFIKTFFFKNSAYCVALSKELIRKTGESLYHFHNRRDLQTTLRNLKEEISVEHPTTDRIRNLLQEFCRNPLLREDDAEEGRLNSLITIGQMGDSQPLALAVFNYLDMVDDPRISLQKSSFQQQAGSVLNQERSIRDEGRLIFLELTERGTSVQERIDSYFANEEINNQDDLWEAPSGNRIAHYNKRNFLIGRILLPERFSLYIPPSQAQRNQLRLQLQGIRDNLNLSRYTNVQKDTFRRRIRELEADLERLQNLTTIEDEILLPICNKEGQLLGHMRMRLEEVGCNIPNAHFFSYIKERDGSWTEHNDSIVTKDQTKQDILPNLLRYGNIFNYSFLEFQRV